MGRGEGGRRGEGKGWGYLGCQVFVGADQYDHQLHVARVTGGTQLIVDHRLQSGLQMVRVGGNHFPAGGRAQEGSRLHLLCGGLLHSAQHSHWCRHALPQQWPSPAHRTQLRYWLASILLLSRTATRPSTTRTSSGSFPAVLDTRAANRS